MDERGDIQAGLPRSDVDAVDQRRADGDRIRVVTAEVEGSAGHASDGTRAAHRDRDSAGARQGQHAGRIKGRSRTTVVDDRQGGQRIVTSQGDAGSATEGERLRRDDAPGRLSEDAVLHDESASTEGRGRAEGQRTRVDDGPSRVGVGTVEDRRTRSHGLTLLARGKDDPDRPADIVGDGGTDGNRTARTAQIDVMKEEISARACGSTGQASVRDGKVDIIVALPKEDAAALDRERVAAQVQVDRRARLAESKRADRSIGKKRGRGRRDQYVVRSQRRTVQPTAGIPGEPSRVQTTQAISGVVARPSALADSPRSDDVVRQRRSRRKEKSPVAADQAGRVEADGGGRVGARKRSDRDIERIDAGTAGAGSQHILTASQGDRTDDL